MNRLTPEEVVKEFEATLGDALTESSVVCNAEGIQKREAPQIWLTFDRKQLKPALRKLATIHYPHLAVISGCDVGEAVELMYHFFIYYGVPHGEYNVTFKISLPKTDLTVDTITDIIPGALTSEREKQEFLGIKVTDIPDDRRMFLPLEFPQGVYPWRKDETGIKEEMVNKLWAAGRPEIPDAEPVAAAGNAEKKES